MPTLHDPPQVFEPVGAKMPTYAAGTYRCDGDRVPGGWTWMPKVERVGLVVVWAYSAV